MYRHLRLVFLCCLCAGIPAGGEGSTEKPSVDARIARLTARAEIEDRIRDWAHGVDRRDWKMAESIFFPDAVVNHGARSSPAALIARLSAAHQSIPTSYHNIGSIRIHFADARTALTETYVLAMQLRPDGDYSMVAGRYVDRFEQRGSIWRIAARTSVIDGMMTVKGDKAREILGSGWTFGSRDTNDPAMQVGSSN